ncbi:MAG: hypothetical protein ACRDRU_20175 [Pseudonocardiaceae bacterium]
MDRPVLPVLLDSLDDHQGERLAGEAKWAREVSAPRLVADLYRKAAALPGAPHELRIAICAREQVLNLPEDVLAITAEDIFGP